MWTLIKDMRFLSERVSYVFDMILEQDGSGPYEGSTKLVLPALSAIYLYNPQLMLTLHSPR